jgi:hypothetical protein
MKPELDASFSTLARLLRGDCTAPPRDGVKRWFEILEPARLPRDRVKTARLPRMRD